jgi:hypothetical protein
VARSALLVRRSSDLPLQHFIADAADAGHLFSGVTCLRRKIAADFRKTAPGVERRSFCRPVLKDCEETC